MIVPQHSGYGLYGRGFVQGSGIVPRRAVRRRVRGMGDSCPAGLQYVWTPGPGGGMCLPPPPADCANKTDINDAYCYPILHGSFDPNSGALLPAYPGAPLPAMGPALDALTSSVIRSGGWSTNVDGKQLWTGSGPILSAPMPAVASSWVGAPPPAPAPPMPVAVALQPPPPAPKPPAPAPVVVQSNAPNPAVVGSGSAQSNAPNQTAAFALPSIFTDQSFGGIPNWMLGAGAVAALVVLPSLFGGRR